MDTLKHKGFGHVLQSHRNHICSYKKATGLNILGRFRITHDSEVTQRPLAVLANEEQNKAPQGWSHLAGVSHPATERNHHTSTHCSAACPYPLCSPYCNFRASLRSTHYSLQQSSDQDTENHSSCSAMMNFPTSRKDRKSCMRWLLPVLLSSFRNFLVNQGPGCWAMKSSLWNHSPACPLPACLLLWT